MKKKHYGKQFLALLLAAIMVFQPIGANVVLNVSAEEKAAIKYEGVAGRNSGIIWSIDENGHLLMEGNDSYENGLTPWLEYAEEIVSAEINVTGLTSTQYMFMNCTNLTEVDLSGMDNSQITNMDGMFRNCSSLTELDLTGLVTKNVENLARFVQGCSSIETIIMDEWDTSNVNNMEQMFCGCTALSTLDLSSFYTGNVQSMNDIFESCENLQNLNIKRFEFNNKDDLTFLFYACNKLTTLDMSEVSITNIDKCTIYWPESLNKVKVPINLNCDINLPNYINKAWMCNGKEYFALPKRLEESIVLELTSIDYALGRDNNVIWKVKDGHLTIEVDGYVEESTNSDYDYQWLRYAREITSATVKGKNATSMKNWFNRCEELTTVDFSEFDSSKVIDMSGLFKSCSHLATIKWGDQFDTSNVTNMNSMFYNCGYLEKLDLSNFNTSKVTDMGSMFEACSNLHTVNLSGFDTKNVKNMSYMFAYDSSLVELDLSGFDMSSVENTSNMFNKYNNRSWNIKQFNTPLHTKQLIDLPLKNDYKWKGSDGNVYISLPINMDKSITLNCVKGVVSSSDIVLKGTSGDLVWTIAANGRFTLSGSGDFERYKNEDGIMVPSWYEARKYIKSAKFDVKDITDLSYMFYEANKLKTVDLTGIDAKKVTDMSHMFEGCFYLSDVNAKGLNTRNVTDMSYLFKGCFHLKNVNLESVDTSNVIDMSCMFCVVEGDYEGGEGDYPNLTLDLSEFDTSNVTNMRGMFWNRGTIYGLDISDFSTDNVTDMSYMFAGCFNELDLSNFNTSNVVNMEGMFKKNFFVSEIDVSQFDTSEVTNMSHMFEHCREVTNINLSSFDTSKVTNMSCMFARCENLTKIDVSNFKTENVTDMSKMFYYMPKINALNLNNFDTCNVENASCMFEACNALKSIDLSSMNFEKANIEGIFISGKRLRQIKTPMNMSETIELPDMGSEKYWEDSSGTRYTHFPIKKNESVQLDLIITPAIIDEGKSGDLYWTFTNEGHLTLSGKGDYKYTDPGEDAVACVAWGKYATEIISAEINVSECTSLAYLFRNCTNLETVDLRNLDTSKVTDMHNMFEWCNSLKSIDVSGLDTSKVTNMSSMFSGCDRLTELDLSNFDTRNVTKIRNMFYECRHLKTIKGLNFDTSKVTDFRYMFSCCSALEQVDLSNFNTQNAKTLNNMFAECSNLTYIDLSGWDTQNVVDMGGLFSKCTSLESVNLTGVDTKKVEDMSGMFSDCINLQKLDLSGFNTKEVENMDSMFAFCRNLKTLDVSAFNTMNVTSMSDMFNTCSLLETLDLTNFDTSKVKDMSGMFSDCTKLQAVDLSSFNTSKVIWIDRIFNGCEQLISLDMSRFDLSKVHDESKNIFSNCKKLQTIKTPKNLKEKLALPKNTTSLWETSDGKVYEYLPIDNPKSVTLTRSMMIYYDTTETVGWSIDMDYHLTIWGERNYLLTRSKAPWAEYADKIVSADVYITDCTSFENMFKGCKNLKFVDFSKQDTSQIINMRGMFEGCSSLESINLDTFNTTRVKDMSNMFAGCINLESLDFSVFELPALTKADNMFNECNKLTDIHTPINLSNKVYLPVSDGEIWSTVESDLYDVLPMDADESMKLQRVDSENLITHSGISGDVNWSISMFGRLVLTGSGNYELISGNTPWSVYADEIIVAEVNVTDMTSWDQMFAGCYNLETVDMSGMNASKVITADKMFDGCKKLTKIHTPSDLSVSVPLPKVDFYQWQDEDGTVYEAFPGDTRILSLEKDPAYVIIETSGDLTYGIAENGELLVTGSGNYGVEEPVAMFRLRRVMARSIARAPWAAYADQIKKATVRVDNITNLNSFFDGCTNLESVDVSRLDTSKVIDMDNMFRGCENLKSIDLREFDTSKVESMNSMFDGCDQLHVLNLSSFDMSNVTDTENFLNDCKSLEELSMPKNVMVETELPDAGIKVWMDAEENVCTKLPMNTAVPAAVSKETSKEDCVASGTSGDLSWTISNDGHFVLSGSGDFDQSNKGWEKYAGEIISAEIDVTNTTTMNGLFDGFKFLVRLDMSKANLSALVNSFALTESCPLLIEIHTPIDLTVEIPLNQKDDFIWKDADGQSYESLPKHASESMVLTGEIVEEVKIPLENITLSKEAVSLKCGDTVILTAEITPADTTDTYTWSTTDKKVAVVKDGLVTALNDGECQIVAESSNGIKASCKITVSHYEKTIVDKEATCGEAGSKHVECTACGHKEAAVEIPSTGEHGMELVVDQKAGCGEAGSGHKECKWCDYAETESIEIPATGKHEIEVEVTKEATCKESGEELHSCKNCQYEYIKVLKKIAHSYDEGHITKEPTCKEAGVKTYTCGNCEYEKTQKLQQSIIHTYGTLVVNTPATFTEGGQATANCQLCGTKGTFATSKVASPECTETVYTYNGKTKKPSVVVKDEAGNELKVDKDYTLSYASGRKSVGKYAVTVTLKGDYRGTEKAYFYIQPKAPTSVKAALYEGDSVNVSWKKATGAKGYIVSYKEAGAEKYEEYKRVTGSSCKIPDLKLGTTYDFEVAPYFMDGTNQVKGSAYGTASTRTLDKMEAPTVGRSSSTKVKVSWTKQSGASGYQISRSTSASKESNKVTTTSGSKTIKVSQNKTYYYKVRAYKLVNGKKIYGPWSEATAYYLRYVSSAKSVKAVLSGEDNRIKVSWSKTSGATGYNLYVKEGKGEYKPVDYLTETSYVTEAMKAGTSYTFKVEPIYIKEGEETVKGSSGTSSVTTLKKLAVPTVSRYKTSTNKVTVKWTNLSGESGFQIWQSETPDGEGIIIPYKTTSGKSKTVTVSQGTTYYYKVRAYKTVGKETGFGPWSDVVAFTIE